MNQQQLAASTDTQTSQSTVSILPNKNTFTKRNDKTNNEIINQNSWSTAIYHPKHGKQKQVAWQHGEAVRRMGAFCSFFSSISCLFSSRSSRADLKTWPNVATMVTMVTTSIQPGDVGILMCTILHQ